MYELTDHNIATWKKDAAVYVPAAIDVSCPACSRLVTFAIQAWSNAPYAMKVSSVPCPGCHARSLFLITAFEGKDRVLADSERLFIDRAPGDHRAIPEILENEQIGDALKRAYTSTVNVFNSAEWSATAVLTRRLLEGVTKSLLSEEEQKLPLAKQVEKLPSVKDLSAPIMTIANAIRKGGNLGAHFDL